MTDSDDTTISRRRYAQLAAGAGLAGCSGGLKGNANAASSGSAGGTNDSATGGSGSTSAYLDAFSN